MTRTELVNMANNTMNEYPDRLKDQLHTCKAWYMYSTDRKFGNYTVLQSYSTAVAIYRHDTGTLFVFDYYSNTTCQHVRKFAKMVNASRITYLYKRSDRVIEEAIASYANTYKLTAGEFRRQKELDFTTYC